jgi:hypothetical protein
MEKNSNTKQEGNFVNARKLAELFNAKQERENCQIRVKDNSFIQLLNSAYTNCQDLRKNGRYVYRHGNHEAHITLGDFQKKHDELVAIKEDIGLKIAEIYVLKKLDIANNPKPEGFLSRSDIKNEAQRIQKTGADVLTKQLMTPLLEALKKKPEAKQIEIQGVVVAPQDHIRGYLENGGQKAVAIREDVAKELIAKFSGKKHKEGHGWLESEKARQKQRATKIIEL